MLLVWPKIPALKQLILSDLITRVTATVCLINVSSISAKFLIEFLVPLISNAVAGIDSVIENISSQLNAFTERNRAPPIQNWLCPKCNLINPSATRYCSTCRFDKNTGRIS